MAAGNNVQGVQDQDRLYYYANYSAGLQRAITEDGVDVRGYFAWSLLDNYEWERGYAERFGTVFNDFKFGYDANAPANKNSQPTPGHQVRQRKDSNCWLEAVWMAEQLVQPGGFVCPDSTVFNGTYTDAAHLSCTRTLKVDANGVNGTLSGTKPSMGMVSACNGFTDSDFGSIPVTFGGTTIIVDFSSIGGKVVQGFWNNDKKMIFWGDGNSWTKQ